MSSLVKKKDCVRVHYSNRVMCFHEYHKNSVQSDHSWMGVRLMYSYRGTIYYEFSPCLL